MHLLMVIVYFFFTSNANIEHNKTKRKHENIGTSFNDDLENDIKKIKLYSNTIITMKNIEFNKTVVCTCGAISTVAFEIRQDVPNNSNPVSKFYTEFIEKNFSESKCLKSSMMNDIKLNELNNFVLQTKMANNNSEIKININNQSATSITNQTNQINDTEKNFECNFLILNHIISRKCNVKPKKDKDTKKWIDIFFNTNQEKVINLFKNIDLIFSKQTNTNKQVFYDKKGFFEKIEQKALKDYYTHTLDLPNTSSDSKKTNNESEINDTQRNFKKTQTDKDSEFKFSRKNVIYNKSNQTYHYAKKYYSDFFVNKHSQDFLGDLIGKNFCFATFLEKLKIKILHSDFYQVSKFTNLMLEENLIYFDHFMKIILACNDNFENKIDFDSTFDFKTKLFQIINCNKKNAFAIIIFSLLLEKFMEKVGIQCRILENTSYIVILYFLYLFEYILTCNWYEFHKNLANELKINYENYVRVKQSHIGFNNHLHKNNPKLFLRNFFSLRVRLEIKKIFAIIIEPFLSTKTIYKYCLFMYTENIVCSTICFYTSTIEKTHDNNYLRTKTIFCLNLIFFSFSNYIRFQDHDIDKKILEHKNSSRSKKIYENDDQFLFETLYQLDCMKSNKNDSYPYNNRYYDRKKYNTKLATLYEYYKNVIKIDDLEMSKIKNYEFMDIENIHFIKILNLKDINNKLDYELVDVEFFICFFDHFSDSNYMSKTQIKRNLHTGNYEYLLSLANCVNYYFENIELEFEESLQNKIMEWQKSFEECKFADKNNFIKTVFQKGFDILSDMFLFC